MRNRRFRKQVERALNVADSRERIRRARSWIGLIKEHALGVVRTAASLRGLTNAESHIVQGRGRLFLPLYAGGSVVAYAVDVVVIAWTLTALRPLRTAVAVVVALVLAAIATFGVHFTAAHAAVDPWSEEITRRRHLWATVSGAMVAVLSFVAIRIIVQMDGSDALTVTRRFGWLPWLLLNVACPVISGSLSSLALYYALALRHVRQLARVQATLESLGELYASVSSTAVSSVPPVIIENATPSWLLAAQPTLAALAPPSDPKPGPDGEQDAPSPVPPAGKRRRRRRSTGDEPPAAQPVRPDPFDGLEIPGNGDSGFSPESAIPPIVRGNVVLLLALLTVNGARAGSCLVGVDATDTCDPSRLRTATSAFVESVPDLVAAFDCEEIVVSHVLDQGRFTPRKRFSVPHAPQVVDCAAVPPGPRSGPERLFRGWDNLEGAAESEDRSECESRAADADRAYRAALGSFTSTLRRACEIAQPRSDVRSPLVDWMDGALNGSERPAVVVLISDGQENPRWNVAPPRLHAPGGTTVVILLVPPRPSVREPRQALLDALAWQTVVPGVHLVPDAEFRSELWREFAGAARRTP